MLRIYAVSVATDMIDNEAIWDCFAGNKHGYTMGFSTCASKCNYSVAVFVFVVLPNMTITNLFPF